MVSSASSSASWRPRQAKSLISRRRICSYFPAARSRSGSSHASRESKDAWVIELSCFIRKLAGNVGACGSAGDAPSRMARRTQAKGKQSDLRLSIRFHVQGSKAPAPTARLWSQKKPAAVHVCGLRRAFVAPGFGEPRHVYCWPVGFVTTPMAVTALDPALPAKRLLVNEFTVPTVPFAVLLATVELAMRTVPPASCRTPMPLLTLRQLSMSI